MVEITPHLWINGEDMEEAAAYYCEPFDEGRVVSTIPYGPGAGEWAGATMTALLSLDGQRVCLLNGAGHHFTPNEASSLALSLHDQAEVDRFWRHFSAEGEAGPCGWVKDRYGFSWQVVPAVLDEMLADPDPARVARVTECFMAVDGRAFDIAELRAAYDG